MCGHGHFTHLSVFWAKICVATAILHIFSSLGPKYVWTRPFYTFICLYGQNVCGNGLSAHFFVFWVEICVETAILHISSSFGAKYVWKRPFYTFFQRMAIKKGQSQPALPFIADLSAFRTPAGTTLRPGRRPASGRGRGPSCSSSRCHACRGWAGWRGRSGG